MPGILENLALGLRGAGGVLSPDVYKGQQEEDLNARKIEETRRSLMAQQVIKGAESGSIPPEQAKAALQKLGFELPAIGPTPEAQQRVAQLENEKGFRAATDAAQGDMSKYMDAAVRYGKPDLAVSIFNAQETRQAQAQDRADKLEMRKAELERAHEYRMQGLQNQQERAAEAARHNQFMEQLSRESKALQAQIATGNQQLRAMQLQMMGDQKTRAEAEKNVQVIERQITNTSNRMKDIQPVATAARQLNNILSEYTPENVPGVGYLKNTNVGQAALTEEGKNVSSSIKLVGNSILKAMSGQAVTPSEEVRQMAAAMNDGRFSAKDFYVAWPKISAWINEQQSLAAAGLTPKAREKFEERTNIKLDPIKPRFEYTIGKDGLKQTDTRSGAASPVRQAADEILRGK